MTPGLDAAAARAQLGTELADMVERLRRSVVQIHARRHGVGSGVIWRQSGLIITNAHVVRAEHAVVELCDGRAFQAEVTARDGWRDLVALTVDASGLPAVELGDSTTLRVGELVLAVGCPWGTAGALSAGIVHAVDARNGGSGRWVRADIRLAPGNSGGPLADARGRVVGINSMIASGLALAVPSEAVERFLRSPAGRPTLGVTVRPVLVALRRGHILGLLIVEIAARSAAEEGGLLIGDILIGAGGRPFASPDDLPIAVQEAPAGAPLELQLVRGGTRLTRAVVPRTNPPGVKAA